MPKKYIVRLSVDERKELEGIVKKGKVAGYKRLNAQILLKADIGKLGSGWTDLKISEAFDVSIRKVERLRERLCCVGFEKCLIRPPSGSSKRKLDGEQEAHLIALTCSKAPEGYARWTLRLLANKMVELGVVDGLSGETVRRVLKKRNKTLAK